MNVLAAPVRGAPILPACDRASTPTPRPPAALLSNGQPLASPPPYPFQPHHLHCYRLATPLPFPSNLPTALALPEIAITDSCSSPHSRRFARPQETLRQSQPVAPTTLCPVNTLLSSCAHAPFHPSLRRRPAWTAALTCLFTHPLARLACPTTSFLAVFHLPLSPDARPLSTRPDLQATRAMVNR